MITDGHSAVANQIHPAEIGLRILEIGFRHPGINVAAG